MSFESFSLHPSIMAGVRELGYTIPTPIQEQAIPLIMRGRDVIGLAQTGTGKTAAFALPMLERLRSGPRRRARALIISPTRELAEQICEVVNGLGRGTGLKGLAVYGGVSMERQTRQLGAGAEIIVACPGRLLDHLRKGNVDLSALEVLVIDEADRMFDMGFLPDVRRILAFIKSKHQTLLFSATMPDNIRRLAIEILNDPATVKVDREAPPMKVSHVLYPVQQHLKTELLKTILNRTKTESLLVFTRTKHRAEKLTRQLMGTGFKVTALQGNMSQNQRQAALDGFRSGSFKILVATDIAARGLDVLSISHVINYDMPDTTDNYIHRVGRTGRINQSGDAMTFVTGEDAALVRELEHLLDRKLERRTLEGFDYKAPAPARAPAQGLRSPSPSPRSHSQAAGPSPRASGPAMRRSRTGSMPVGARNSSGRVPGTKPGSPGSKQGLSEMVRRYLRPLARPENR